MLEIMKLSQEKISKILLQNFVLLKLLISKCYEDAKNKTSLVEHSELICSP